LTKYHRGGGIARKIDEEVSAGGEWHYYLQKVADYRAKETFKGEPNRRRDRNTKGLLFGKKGLTN